MHNKNARQTITSEGVSESATDISYGSNVSILQALLRGLKNMCTAFAGGSTDQKGAAQRMNFSRSEVLASDAMLIPKPSFFYPVLLFYANATLSVTNITAANIRT
ncbi:hypothetical protein EVAR_37229_1 [Eumeta japonica]|uniref:Uncharacterized protein n=1 Tax=Eumeta variegata TaxID=151549 RepID=A0A4C1Y894_EUMVA|nr:hypothetical protein EVAR_37229_1 [Eumeta japonica]